MKTIIRLVIIHLFISLSSYDQLIGQCPEGEVVITSQSEMFAFERRYPNCTEINGSLILSGVSNGTSDIYDARPLSKIKVVRGGFEIRNCPLIEDLSFIPFERIDEQILIYEARELTNLDFLSKIKSIAGLYLYDLENLVSIEGLSEIEEINGALQLNFLPKLISPTSFKLQRVDSIFSLYVLNELRDLNFLSNLEFVQRFSVNTCESLIDISGISSIKNKIEYLSFYGNSSLNECSTDGLCQVITAAESFNFQNNGTNCSSSLGVISQCNNQNAPCRIESINLVSQSDVNFFGTFFGSCDTIYGSLNVRQDRNQNSDPIVDLSPLKNIKAILGNFNIYDTDLIDLKGLENLRTVERGFTIRTNDKLESFEGLVAFDSIGFFTLYENNSFESLSTIPFENLKTESINIQGNESLIDISEISKIERIGTLSISTNHKVKDCTAVFSIPEIGNLSLYGMNGLVDCVDPNSAIEQNIGQLTVSHCLALEEIVFRLNSTINERITLRGNDELTTVNLSGLSPSLEQIQIIDNEKLVSFIHGAKLEEVTGYYSIGSCPELQVFSFNQLRKIKYFELFRTDKLQTLGASSVLDSIGYVYLGSNAILADISAFDRKIGVDSLYFVSNDSLTNCQIEAICHMADLNKARVTGNGKNCNSVTSMYTVCNDSLRNPIGDVVLNSFSDLEILMEDYPNADSIFGELKIENYLDIETADLDFFKQIKYIKDGINLRNTNIDSIEAFADIKFHSLHTWKVHELGHLPLFTQIDSFSSLELHSMDSINSISGLMNLEYVEGELELNNMPNLRSIEGLNNIKSIDFMRFSSVAVQDFDPFQNLVSLNGMNIWLCRYLNSIEGLSNVTNLYSITIWDNYQLRTLMKPLQQDSIHYVYFNDNAQLEEINCFENITKIGRFFRISSNNALKSIELPNLQFMNIESNNFLVISRNLNLESISFPKLETGPGIEITNNRALASIETFSNLKICEYLEIVDNSSLSDISQFNDELVINDYLYILNNPELSLCNRPFICNHLYHGKPADFVANGTGCETEAQVEINCGFNAEACPSVGYTMNSNRSVELYNTYYSECIAIPGVLHLDDGFSLDPQLGKIEFIRENLKIGSHNISSLDFTNLETVARDLLIQQSEDLKEINFPSLRYFPLHRTDIIISDNSDLSSTPRFPVLDNFINSNIEILRNENLKTVEGLEELKHAERITITDNPNLETIDGLDQIQILDKLEIINNLELTNLPVFDQERGIKEIIIQDNPLLSNCSIEGLCIHLENDRTASISNNMIGCNNKSQILEGCFTDVDDVFTNQQTIHVYPNPTSSMLYIENINMIAFDAIRIYNVSGQLIETFKPEIKEIDISGFSNGMYFIQFKGALNQGIVKLIKL